MCRRLPGVRLSVAVEGRNVVYLHVFFLPHMSEMCVTHLQRCFLFIWVVLDVTVASGINKAQSEDVAFT